MRRRSIFAVTMIASALLSACFLDYENLSGGCRGGACLDAAPTFDAAQSDGDAGDFDADIPDDGRIHFVSASSAATPSPALNLSIARPANIKEGDLLLLAIVNQENVAHVKGVSGGWVNVGATTHPSSSPNEFFALWYYRVASSVEPENYVVDATGYGPDHLNAVIVAAGMVAYRGVDTTALIDGGTHTIEPRVMEPLSTGGSSPALTTIAPNSLVVEMFLDGFPTKSWMGGGAFSPRVDNHYVFINDVTVPSPGPAPIQTYLHSTTADHFEIQVVALAPR